MKISYNTPGIICGHVSSKQRSDVLIKMFPGLHVQEKTNCGTKIASAETNQ